MQLDHETVAPYLAQQGVVPDDADAVVSSLGGGVSNGVFHVAWEDDAIVVKQPLANLAVEDDWPADVDRVHNEAAAATAYRRVVDKYDLDVVVPSVRFEDRDNHVIAIDAAPLSAATWKTELLEGRVDGHVGAVLGSFLGAAHEFAATDPAVEGTFSNYTPFEQLRLDPYHATVAERHPDVAAVIEREIERIRGTRSTLVHGDYSPKNVLVEGGAGSRRVLVLDFEVAHWGDPAFDVAFMLNHLCIKSVYTADQHEAYIATARRFWDAYGDATRDDGYTDEDFETNVVAELGVLMLARVDGKSPVEYVTDRGTKERLRTVAKTILTADVTTLEGVLDVLRSEVAET
jgi:5-methylthioribose kinase